MQESFDSDLLLLRDIMCIPFFCRSNQTKLSHALWSAQWIAPFWPHHCLPLLPLWRVDESRPHKEWPELPTLRWGEAVQFVLCILQTVSNMTVIIRLLFSYVTTMRIGFMCKVYTVSCRVNPLCMINCFNSRNFAIQCDRLFYWSSQISSLCKPFGWRGWVALLLYWWCWVSKDAVIASAPNQRLSGFSALKVMFVCHDM